MFGGRGNSAFSFLNTFEKSLEDFQKYQNGILIENEVLGEYMGSRPREKAVPYTLTRVSVRKTGIISFWTQRVSGAHRSSR